MNVSFCFLTSYPSLEDALSSFHSRSQIKKFLPKSQRKRSVREREEVFFSINLAGNMINPKYFGPEIKVLFSDERFCVLEKPHGVATHPLTYEGQCNCLSFLREHSLANLEVAPEHRERGLLYRLDQETSGLLIYVNDSHLHRAIRENYSSFVKTKKYYAWVSAKIQERGKFETRLEKSGPKGQKMKEDHQKGQKATISWEKKEEFKDYALIEISLKEGIRHQIRAQLSLLGHPIVGDALYGGDPSKRIWLHALSYKLEDGTSFQVDPKGFIQDFQYSFEYDDDRP